MKDLEFGIRWKLNTAEVSNAADKIVTSIGTITSAIVGLLASGFQFDNFLGLLNTKISSLDGNLQNVGRTLENVINSQNKFTSGLSVDTMQKIAMGFTTQSTMGEKYSDNLGKNMQNYQDSAGMLIKGMNLSVGEATNTLTSFRKTLMLSYEEMPKFSNELVNISRTANLSSKETKVLVDQSVQLARAYGLVGEKGQEFVKNQLILTSTLSQLGLEADSVQRKLNAMTDGSEAGAVQALLLGYDPMGDQTNTAEMLKNKASDLVGMVSGMPVQLQSMMLKEMAPAMGMGSFNIDELRQMAAGGSLEAKKEGLDPATVNKEILEYLKDPARSGVDFYKTAGQGLTDAVKGMQMLFMDKFKPALEEFKAGMEKFKTETLPKISKFIDDVLSFAKKIQDFIGIAGKEGGFGNMAIAGLAAAAGLAIVQTVLASATGLMITAVKSLLVGSLTLTGVATIIPIVIAGLLGYGVGTIINAFLGDGTKQIIGDAVFSMMPDWLRKMVGAPTRDEVNKGEKAAFDIHNSKPSRIITTDESNQKFVDMSGAIKGRKANISVEDDTKLLFLPKINEMPAGTRSDISRLGETLGLRQTSDNLKHYTNRPAGRSSDSLHDYNLADDFGAKEFNPKQTLDILKTFESHGYKARFETAGAKPSWLPQEYYLHNSKTNADHFHVEDIQKAQALGIRPKTDLADSDKDSGKTLKVKDETISDKLSILIDLMRGQQQAIAYQQPSGVVTSYDRSIPYKVPPGVGMLARDAEEAIG